MNFLFQMILSEDVFFKNYVLTLRPYGTLPLYVSFQWLHLPLTYQSPIALHDILSFPKHLQMTFGLYQKSLIVGPVQMSLGSNNP